ncbi:MAG: helix-turn-helix transcriptional regulator [Gammaproteobacteria bacterium]|nr:helix-turn-helix transcriptional regulator [Gammaproteobacteria bacterium]
MLHNYDFRLASSETIEHILGKRIEAIRLTRNITQSQLAREAGVSRSTVTRLAQQNKGISLDSFIRILKALHLESNLETLLPDSVLSPLDELEKNTRPARKRARPTKKNQKKWTWSDKSKTP